MKETVKIITEGLQLIAFVAFSIGFLALTWAIIAKLLGKTEKANKCFRSGAPILLLALAALISLELCKTTTL